jgi:hypothetical protein
MNLLQRFALDKKNSLRWARNHHYKYFELGVPLTHVSFQTVQRHMKCNFQVFMIRLQPMLDALGLTFNEVHLDHGVCCLLTFKEAPSGFAKPDITEKCKTRLLEYSTNDTG